MSIRIMSQVWEHSKASGSALLVLLAVADFANDAGTAYPAVETLAVKARMTGRNCQYALIALEEMGELEIQRNKGPRGCNLFRVKTLQGEKFSGVKPVVEGVKESSPQGVKESSPEPSLEPSLTVKRKLRMEDFNRFYSAFPKKRSKGRALTAFSKINPDEQLMQAILAGIERAKTWDDWRKEGGKYIPYPASWLNDRGWEDEDEPVAPRGPRW